LKFSILTPSVILFYEKKIMKKIVVFSIPLAATLCILLLFSCTSVDGDTEPYKYCVFPEDKECLEGVFYQCPNGGQLGDICPFTVSNPSSPSSSSRLSSSSGSGYYCRYNGSPYSCVDISSYAGTYTLAQMQAMCSNAGYTFTTSCP